MNSKRFANSQAEVFDDDIFLDEEDRLRLNMMSEKEREIEIFKRIEKREVRKARYVVHTYPVGGTLARKGG